MLKMEIATDNMAFDDPTELPRILKKVAQQIEDGVLNAPVYDINGNRVGEWKIR